MANGVLGWAKRHRAHLVQTLDLMKTGQMFVFEERSGQRVDVTSDEIQRRTVQIGELDTLISDHQPDNTR